VTAWSGSIAPARPLLVLALQALPTRAVWPAWCWALQPAGLPLRWPSGLQPPAQLHPGKGKLCSADDVPLPSRGKGKAHRADDAARRSTPHRERHKVCHYPYTDTTRQDRGCRIEDEKERTTQELGPWSMTQT
jgi:hypothetical protein